MKKVLSVVAALLLCIGAQAQIVSSRSAIIKTERQPSSTQWFLRAGLNVMSLSGTGAEDTKSNIGYNATVGYQKALGSAGGYWGMEFGLGSRGFKDDGGDVKCIAHNVQYSPFTFGWKFNVAEGVKIDPHAGVYASYDYTSKMKEEGESMSWGDFADYMEVDYNHYDVGMNIGVGVWYDRFNLDFTYQRGFIDVFSDADGIKTSNFMIRLGIAF